MFRVQSGHGQPQRTATQFHALHGPLERDRVSLDKQMFVYRHQLELDFHRASAVAGDCRNAQFMHPTRRDVGGDTDIALPATQHQRNGGRVVARVNREATGYIANQPLCAFQIAGGLLDAHDARYPRQAQHGVVNHVGHASARYVVQHHRQFHRLGDGFKVLVQALLRRLVVVRHHLQMAIGADLAREFGQFDGFGCGVGAAAGHDRHAALGLFNRNADDLAVLLQVDGRRLAGGAHHAYAVRPLCDMPVDQLAQRGVIHTAVVVHRRDKRHDAASNRSHKAVITAVKNRNAAFYPVVIAENASV